MRITKDNINSIFMSKVSSVDTMQLKGYTLIKEIFADSSGMGQDNELASTKSQFIKEIESILTDNPVIYTMITSVGQFQVYIGVFIKTGKSNIQKIANNTYRINTDTGYKIRLHDTDILTFKNNTVTLNNNGYFSKTSKDRINTYLTSYQVKQKNYEWYVVNTKTGVIVEYKNGLVLEL